MSGNSKYISSALLLLISSVIVKIIGAVYKIPLTAFIGAVGRGYFASAYNIYMPVHAVIMGAFPVALSKLTSKYNAVGDTAGVAAVKKGASRLFFKVGFVGMAVVLLMAKPYCTYIAASPKSLYTVLVIAPSILFSAMAASYRGFYEGYMNMRPTAVSQTLEALFKMVFGLVFARVTMAYLMKQFADSSAVLGTAVSNEKEALSLIYPVSSAAAMLGVTFGSLISLIYVCIYDGINRQSLPRAGRNQVKEKQSELFHFSLPIMISTAVQSVFQFVDTATVQLALSKAGEPTLKTAFSDCIRLSGVQSDDLVTYVYGLFSTALDFKNLIPGITMALGICAVPAVSAAYELKNREHLSNLINEIYQYTVLLSVFGGIFLALCSGEVLRFFYQSSSPDIPLGCDAVVHYFALTVPFYCLAGSAVFCVQAIGKAEKCITPYIVCGMIRAFGNIILVRCGDFLLFGAVISGAAGYAVMAVWNMIILNKYTKMKFNIRNVISKPLAISLILYIFLEKLYDFISFSQNLLINLLIKGAICGVVFCILCLLFKALNFRDVFCDFHSKKNPRNTCN